MTPPRLGSTRSRWMFGAACGALLALFAAPAMAASCESLAGLSTGQMTITRASPAGALAGIATSLKGQPDPAPFCRVAGYLTPTRDSHIAFEVWLPAPEAWNGKFQSVGNGGFLGALNYRAALQGLNRHYAVMTTDLGHENAGGAAEDATWALGHPEQVIDYAYRGEHLSTLAAKTLIAAYYGAAPKHSYFTGCSAGGVSGMTELLRYPDDYDGYLIGDALPDHLGQEVAALWTTLEASLKYPDQALKPGQVAALHDAVLHRCAGKDGGLSTDAFLTDPSKCRFDPATLKCRPGAVTGTCLSTEQVAIVEHLYGGPRNPRTGQALMAGITPGSEKSWDKYFTGRTNPAEADRPWSGFLTYMAYSDPDYLKTLRYLKFDFERDVTALRRQEIAGETLDASWNSRNRDIDAFAAAGGKVIQYHGLDDPNISPLEAVAFRESLIADLAERDHLTRAAAAEKAAAYYRLFMIAGMGHCAGGDGPWKIAPADQNAPDPQHDMLTALERWVEAGVPPEQFIGAHPQANTGSSDMTRPVCVYPKVPVWTGQGAPSDAGNFKCTLKD